MAQKVDSIFLEVDIETGGVLASVRTFDRATDQIGNSFRQLDTQVSKSAQAVLQSLVQAQNGVKTFATLSKASFSQVEQGAASLANNFTGRFNDSLVGLQKQTRKSRGAFRAMRGSIGQLGFQLQDVAVQFQSGTDAAIIFVQQGSQIASIFGPGGAVIGAILAVSAAIGASLIPALGDAEEGLDKLPKDLAERINKIKEELGETDRLSIGSVLQVEVGRLNTEYDALTGKIQLLNDEISNVQENIRQGVTEPLAGLAQIEGLQNQITNAQERQLEIGKAIEQVTQTVNDELTKGAKGVDEANSELQKQLEIQKELDNQLAIANARINGGTEAALKLATAFQLGLTNAEQLPQEISRTIEQIAKAEERLKKAREQEQNQDQFSRLRQDIILQQQKNQLTNDEFELRKNLLALGSEASPEQREEIFALTRGLQELRFEAELAGQSLNEALGNAGVSALNSLSDGLADVIVNGGSATEVVRNLASTVATELLSSIIRYYVGQAAAALLGIGQTTAAGVAQASALTSAYAPAAVAANIATSGGAALAAAASAPAASAATIGAITSANVAGARYNGGGVMGGSMYEVGERNKPELLLQGSKQYLIPGNNGEVVSNRDMMGGGNGNMKVNVNISAPAGFGGEATARMSGMNQLEVDARIYELAPKAVAKDMNRRGVTHSAMLSSTNTTNKTRG